MMHYWNDGYDNWWWMIPMTVGMLAVVVAVIWALLQASRTHQPASSPPVRSTRPTTESASTFSGSE